MARPSGRRTSQFQLPGGQPRSSVPAVMNQFVGGLKTEFTGLNFPENSCTATENCTFTRTGSVTRRPGIDQETQGIIDSHNVDPTNNAISTFLWENAGGDGNTTLYVKQVGASIKFRAVSGVFATSIALSRNENITGSPIDISSFVASGGSFDTTKECQYTSGNGYLFIFHPSCDPIYVTYNASSNPAVVAASITLQMRDFVGINDNLPVNFRPSTLSAEHQYNLTNQGWVSGSPWTGLDTALGSPNNIVNIQTGSQVFLLSSNSTTTLTNGDIIQVTLGTSTYTQTTMIGTVTAYTAGTSVTLNISSISGSVTSGTFKIGFHGTHGTQLAYLVKINTGFIDTWLTAEGNYPSNSDIWYLYKNSSDAFDPATTQVNVAAVLGQAPQGHFVLNVFNQDRSNVSSVTGLTAVSTTARPKTGAWFQGRVWYSGVDSSFPPTGDEPFSTWSENLYFSQIVTTTQDFGLCYQVNDPASETLNTLLPDDGGVIQIQGCGSIYKLFPVVNGLLVFAANGIWFVTGNTGLGFTANDFSVTKISGEHSISGSSFVSIQGWPMFWNADAIYSVQPGQSYTSGQTALQVKNITLETIKTAYQAIPLSSKKYARGTYNHLTGEIRWLYLSTEASSVANSYQFDSVLNLLTYTNAFYQWTLPITSGIYVHAVDYIEGPGGINVTPPVFKYLVSDGNLNWTFCEENNTSTYTDFPSLTTGVPFTSFFQTGYSLKGQALVKFQPQYVYIYSEVPASTYTIQGIWNYASSKASGKFTSVQVANNNTPTYGKNWRRWKIPGNGTVLQLLISSSDGQPFNISGWAILDTTNMGT